jgi:hypothetical protein
MQLSCPACLHQLQWRELDFRVPFRCSACHAELRIPSSYGRIGGFIALAVSVGLAYAFGARGFSFAAIVGVAFFPIMWIAFIVHVAVSPPTIYLDGPPTITTRSNPE